MMTEVMGETGRPCKGAVLGSWMLAPGNGVFFSLCCAYFHKYESQLKCS